MKSLIFAVLCLAGPWALAQKSFRVSSPDNRLSVDISVTDRITYSVISENEVMIAPSPISMKLTNGDHLGVNPRVRNSKKRSVNQTISSPFYKRSSITDQFNELTVLFKGDYQLTFRVYNEGAAYRFSTTRKESFDVENEEVRFNFPADVPVTVPYVNQQAPASFDAQFFNSFENTYSRCAVSAFDPKRLAFLPIIAGGPGSKRICITEADLEDYPGMYVVNPDGERALHGLFAAVPRVSEQGGHNKLQEIVRERQPFIAHGSGTRSFPWRVVAVSKEDKELADNDLVYKLAAPSRVADVTWIKPGKVAWDWWNDWNVYGVDFKAGINNATYKYYIDFASEHGIPYVILDEGWSVNLMADLLQVVPEIDMKDLATYGKSKNVGLVLWAGYYAFNRDMENVCRRYSELGVKGFKVDFMDRDDQPMVNFYYRAAAMAAKYHLFLDFHGAYKPTGLLRTFPNVLNSEGVYGLEQLKWSPPSVDQVTYDVTIPFIRMVAGPMDYTPGAMRNATKENYRPINSEPMSQGTRCHQLAEYVVFEGPFSMLSDNPANYRREPECTQFIADVPTTWDNTTALDGKVGEYVAIGRQKGTAWYAGGLNNWNARELVLNFGFLPPGNFKAEVFRDGDNADRVARDFKHEIIDVPADRLLKIAMAPGGGFAMRIYPR